MSLTELNGEVYAHQPHFKRSISKLKDEKNKYKKYDILEIVWLDSHGGGGWKTPSEVEKWIERAKTNFIIKSVGYFIHEDNDFLRIAQSYDNQILDPEGQGDNNIDGMFAIAKTAIKSIKKIKSN